MNNTYFVASVFLTLLICCSLFFWGGEGEGSGGHGSPVVVKIMHSSSFLHVI